MSEEIAKLRSESRITLKDRSLLEQKKHALENLLSDNLLRRKQEKEQELEDLSLTNTRSDLESVKSDYGAIEARLAKTQSRLEEMARVQQELTENDKQIRSQLDEAKANEKELAEFMAEDSKAMDKLANKKSLYLKKKEDAQKKMREIGSLPEGHQQFQNLRTKELWNRVQKCNAELKNYSHVNKKALEQFVQFSELKEKLLKRREEVDKSNDSIYELINVLELRKYEAILSTFNQVSRFFSEVSAQHSIVKFNFHSCKYTERDKP